MWYKNIITFCGHCFFLMFFKKMRKGFDVVTGQAQELVLDGKSHSFSPIREAK